jgi:glucose-6-phosphate 1-dehydrogenase
MEKERSDAFVFFGASGHLAYKKIFPALQAMARRGKLDCLVIGVAKSSWVLDQLVERPGLGERERRSGSGRIRQAGLRTGVLPVALPPSICQCGP